MTEVQPIRRALISVYDKAGVAEIASELAAAGVEIVSTGSTAKLIADAGVAVTPVEDVTGFPECLDGRVKTLHPKIHAGILADRRLESHVSQLEELEVKPFDLVIVNLYPFAATVASGASFDESIEQIDIGGPTMVRASAKNHASVAIVTSPKQYDLVREAIAAGGTTLEQRAELATAAFRHTAAYDIHVANWLGGQTSDETFPEWLGSSHWKHAELRYGENPHQKSALYRSVNEPGLATANQLHGKEMSHNNYVDADAALRAAYDHEEPCVAIVKHANPCGIALGSDIADAHRKAHECDPVSAFGGVIAANRPISLEMAQAVADIFTEVIVAPGYEEGAVEALQSKKNIRILELPDPKFKQFDTREISGGLLMQETDRIDAEGDDPATWTLACGEAADEATLRDLAFAWRSVRAVKSNGILLAKDGAAVGVGMGQVSRVDSCYLAAARAEDRAQGSVAASDAFFPFADGPDVLLKAGVKAIVQPGGSVRDQEVIDAVSAAGVTMYFTGTRHFFH